MLPYMRLKSTGFTMVELIVVIVLLGVLSATALPKFMDFSGSAKKSTLKTVKGAIEEAVISHHAEAILAGRASAHTDVYRTDEGVQLWSGGWVYSGDWENGVIALDEVPEIMEAAGLAMEDWLALHQRPGLYADQPSHLYLGFPVEGVSNSVSHYNKNIDVSSITNTECYIRYTTYWPGANATLKPVIDLVDSGC